MFLGKRTTAVYVGNNRVLCRTRNGYKMFVDSRDVSLAPHIILEGVWEEATESVLRSLVTPGMTVIEVGSNVGFFSLILAHCVGKNGRFVGFEADPELAMIARDNVEINGFHHQATIIEAAAGASDGKISFFRADRHRGNGTVLSDLEQIPHNRTDTRQELEVDLIRLDSYCHQANVVPDLIKIDAEGAESAILAGAHSCMQSMRPLTLVLEFAPRFVQTAGDDPTAFLDRLASAGFTLHVIDERKRTMRPTSHNELLGREFSEIVAVRGDLKR